MATMTLTACANSAAQFFGALDSGESLSTQQIADALSAVNNLIDNWSIDRLMAVSAGLSTVATSPGTISYALGTRVSMVESASVLTPSPSLPLKVCNAVEWSSIPDRGVSGSFIRLLMELLPDRPDVLTLMQPIAIPSNTILAPLIHLLLDKTGDRADLIIALATSGITNAAALAGLIRMPGTPQGPAKAPDMLTILACMNNQPRYLFYDRGNPTGTIYLAGAPQSGTVQLVTWTALSQFADATTPLTMPPGFARVLQLAAAIELAPQFETAPSERLLADHADAISRWRQLNASILGPEPAGGIATPAAAPNPVVQGQ